MNKLLMVVAAALACPVFAQTIVDVNVTGQDKTSVAIKIGNAAYANSLRKNLELSGLFSVQASGTITVSGNPGGAVTAVGRGKQVTSTAAVTDDKSARMAARQLADAMVNTYSDGRQKGFACDRIAFVNRKGADNAELCMCFPDGYDIRQLTGDARATVGPRWKNRDTLFYTGFLKGGPRVYELDVGTGSRRMPWDFKGLTTGAAVSPDGSKVAIVLSFQGNPELYILQGTRYIRLTNTPNASEGQPSWSPDGRQIVYVSDETRHPQLYVVDVATKQKRRLTSRGSQNVDPDWGDDGRITYITKRGGSQVAVIDPRAGEGSVKLIGDAGNWEHPSWARDARHIVASSDRSLWILDTLEGGDKPRKVFTANGNWITPSWAK